MVVTLSAIVWGLGGKAQSFGRLVTSCSDCTEGAIYCAPTKEKKPPRKAACTRIAERIARRGIAGVVRKSTGPKIRHYGAKRRI